MDEDLFITDDCVIKDDTYNSIKDIILCKECQKILKEPMFCVNCQNNFCKNCIKNNCCENPNYVPSKDKRHTLSILKFLCRNCYREIKYDDVESHLKAGCKKVEKPTKLIDLIYNQKRKKFRKLDNDEIKALSNQKLNHLSSKNKFFYFYYSIISNNIRQRPCR